MIVEWIVKGKPSALGLASGVVAGLVAITPACGFVGVMGAIALGAIVSPISFLFCSGVKSAFGYDDALDVFGVHQITLQTAGLENLYEWNPVNPCGFHRNGADTALLQPIRERV